MKIVNFCRKMASFVSVIWVNWKQSVSSITLPYSSTFYSLFLPFFVLEIFKFKYDKFFVRHYASISKFKWSEQPCFIHIKNCKKTSLPGIVPYLWCAVFSRRGSINDIKFRNLLHGEAIVSPNPKVILSIIKQSKYFDEEILKKGKQ